MNPQRKPHSAGDVIEAQGDKILALTQRLELADALADAVEANINRGAAFITGEVQRALKAYREATGSP